MKVNLKFPAPASLTAFLNAQQTLAYTYSEVGATQKDRVSGFDNDHTKILLGKSDLVWETAKAALLKWEHFPWQWTRIFPLGQSIEKGAVVAVVFKVLGLWWTNSARIVYKIDTSREFGFAYGTLPGHMEKGEEIFYIDRSSNGDIHYHIKAFSTPRFWLARLGYPLARLFQRRFVKASMQRMKKICETPHAKIQPDESRTSS